MCRNLQRHKVIVSGGKVNWLIRPSIDPVLMIRM